MEEKINSILYYFNNLTCTRKEMKRVYNIIFHTFHKYIEINARKRYKKMNKVRKIK